MNFSLETKIFIFHLMFASKLKVSLLNNSDQDTNSDTFSASLSFHLGNFLYCLMDFYFLFSFKTALPVH